MPVHVASPTSLNYRSTRMTTRAFVKKHLGKRCYVTDATDHRRWGRITGVSEYNTVVVEFEPYPPPGKVGQSQEWPMDRITVME